MGGEATARHRVVVVVAVPALRGVYLPIVTPLAADGSVDLAALGRLGHHYLEAGVAGLVALGTTGEPATLSAVERQQVVETCGAVCAERDAALLVGPGSNDTAGTVAAVQELAKTEGVSGALCVVPYYTRPGQAGIVAHFRAVADASPVPVVLYNIPSRTGQALEPDGLLTLAAHPNVIGVKQSVPLDGPTLRLLAEKPADFSVLCGEDAYVFPMTLLGGSGAIAAAAHVCTTRIVAMVTAALDGRLEEGRAHHRALLPVFEAMFAEPSPTLFKAVLHRQGLIATPAVRLPLVAPSTAGVEAALRAISAATSG